MLKLNAEIKDACMYYIFHIQFFRDILYVMNEVYYFGWSMEEYSQGVMHGIFGDDISVLDKSLVVAILKIIWSASFCW